MIQTDFYTIFLDILSVVMAFLSIIGIHEIGHFLAARCVKVKVLRLNLGFGKPFWQKTSKSGVEYAISPFLLGGYVKLLDEREGPVSPEFVSQSVTRQSLWKRLIILLAGPFTNFIFSLFLFMIVFSNGLPSLQPVVGKVFSGSIAEKAGFKKNDRLIAVNNHFVTNWIAVNFYLLDVFGSEGKLSVVTQSSAQREEVFAHRSPGMKTIIIPLSDWKLDPLHPNVLMSLGIQPALNKKWEYVEKCSFWAASLTSFHYVMAYLKVNTMIVYKVIRGILSIRSFAGPISVFVASAESAQKGWVYYCFFLAFLSASVGFFNLLPIPGLDGFQILIVLIEKIKGSFISSALQVLLYQLGLIALALLCVQVFLNDIARYGKFFPKQ